jgi:hypothetical protein
MTRHHDTTRDTKGDSPGARVVSVSQAAAALSVTVRTVQRRLDSGVLRSEKRNGRRFVVLPSDGPADEKTGATEATPNATFDTTQNTTTRHPNATDGDMASRLIAQLEAENRFLKGELETAHRNHALGMAAMREALKALPKALPAPAAETATGAKNLSKPVIQAANDGAGPTVPKATNGPQKGTEREKTGRAMDWADIEV